MLAIYLTRVVESLLAALVLFLLCSPYFWQYSKSLWSAFSLFNGDGAGLPF